MFIIGNLLEAIADIINLFVYFYMFIVVIAAFISWLHVDPYNPVVQILHQLTEPVFRFVRRHLPVAIGGIDLSPMIVIAGCVFIQKFIVNSLLGIAFRLK
ncbi:MAG: YggT family protein [bacterium]